MKQLHDKIQELFKDKFTPAHDIKHILRVAGLSRQIANAEGYDSDEAEAAGLLHDLGRALQQEEAGHAEAGAGLAREYLDEYTGFNEAAKLRIISAIEQHSARESEGKLAHILQDADKLDGLGAIGLVRAYTSKSHLEDYPDGVIVGKGSRNASTISEQVAFQLEWHDMLYTDAAKAIAKPRYEFMVKFMEQLKQEVNESLS